MLGRVEKTVARYQMVRPGDLVLAAVSGGKDSASLLHLLSRLREKLGFRLKGLHIDLGIGEYSKRCRKAAEALSEALKIPALTIDLEELGIPIPKLAKYSRKGMCSICGTVKRYLMNFSALAVGAASVATGHILDDAVHLALKVFLTSEPSQLAVLRPAVERFEGLAVAKIKPLIEVSGKESLTYALVNRLPFYHGECPYHDERFINVGLREFQDKLEDEHPGIKLSFIRRFNKLLTMLPQADVQLRNVRKCTVCGMISQTEKCAFCRLVERALGDAEKLNYRLKEMLASSPLKAA